MARFCCALVPRRAASCCSRCLSVAWSLYSLKLFAVRYRLSSNRLAIRGTCGVGGNGGDTRRESVRRGGQKTSGALKSGSFARCRAVQGVHREVSQFCYFLRERADTGWVSRRHTVSSVGASLHGRQQPKDSHQLPPRQRAFQTTPSERLFSSSVQLKSTGVVRVSLSRKDSL